MKKNKWYSYMWIWTILYFVLGFFNIFFAWLGLIDFTIPLVIAVVRKNKWWCSNMCGRGELLTLLGDKIKGKNKCQRTAPKWLHSKPFKYGFLTFFLTMFGNMIVQTVLVAKGAKELKTFVKLFWTFNVPWHWAYVEGVFPAWAARFAYGFYSTMLSSTIIAVILMFIYRSRTWCTFCPMGTMTSTICSVKKN